MRGVGMTMDQYAKALRPSAAQQSPVPWQAPAHPLSDAQMAERERKAFEQIEAAVKETVRGRWFLEEFARRNRNADTLAILDALGRLESAVAAREPPENPRRNTQGSETWVALRRRIAEAGDALRAFGGGGIEPSRGEPFQTIEASLRVGEDAVRQSRAVAAKVQEYAWHLREDLGPHPHIDALEASVSTIYAGSAVHELTVRRLETFLAALRDIDSLAREALAKAGMSTQSGIEDPSGETGLRLAREDPWTIPGDAFIVDETPDFITPEAPPSPVASPPRVEGRSAAMLDPHKGAIAQPGAQDWLSELDARSTAERLRAFR